MNKTAIDVVLLPPPAMAAKAIEINAELLKSFEDKIILNTEDCLPHISLCMGVVDNEDLPKVTKILNNIAGEYRPLQLSAEYIKAATIPTGEKVSGLHIANTNDLQNIHESIMQKLRHLLSYEEVEASMFYHPAEIEEVTFTWVKGYGDQHDNPALFNPHLTVGLGETDKFAFPIDFTTSTLALCQLGNYCTCRKVLSSFSLAASTE